MSNLTIEEAVETAAKIRKGAFDIMIDQSDLRAKVKHNGRVGLRSLVARNEGTMEIDSMRQSVAAQSLNLNDIRLSPIAKRQIANAVGIPVAYWKRCEASDPEMLVDHINHWLPKSNSRRMVRMVTTDGGFQHCRAFLSNRFMPVDSYWVLDQIKQNIGTSTPWRISVDENGMNFSSRSDLLTKELEDQHSKKIGDVMQGGIRVLNSEVGGGRVMAQLCLYRLVCLNGMTMPIGLGGYSRRHVGAAKNSDVRVLRDLWKAMNNILGGEQFDVAMEKIGNAVNQKMAKDWIPRLVKDNDLDEAEKAALTVNYQSDHNLLNLWGAVNSVTALAHGTKSVDRKTQLEAIGGRLLTSPKYLVAA